MASTMSTKKDSEKDVIASSKEDLSKRYQLVTASVPFQCSKRCNETLPDWPVTLDFLIDNFLKSEANELSGGGDDDKHYNMGIIVKNIVESLFEETSHLNREKMCGCGGKNADSAGALKVVGNELFSKGQFLLAIKFYSAAMAICPADVNLAVLYSNRSAAAARFGQFENALEDIISAIKLQFPREKQGKLFLRKADCLLKLGRSAELAEFLEITSSAGLPVFSAEEQTRWESFKNVLSLPRDITVFPSTDLGKYLNVANVIETLSLMGLFRTGNKLPWLSKRVKLVCDPNSNKYRIVTLKKIEAGKVLAVVKPFAVVPLDENNKPQKNSFERCHHCTATIYRSAAYIEKPELLKAEMPKSPIRMNNPVACTKCSDVLFCSIYCATKACSYHRFECGHLSLLRSLGTESHLALRVLYSTGSTDPMHELSLEEEKSAINAREVIEKSLAGVPPPCARLDKLDDDFRRLFYSAQMAEEYGNKCRSFITTNVLLKLCQYSSFFKTGQDCVVGGKMLLRMQSQLKRNLVVVARRNYRSLSSTDAYDRFQVATGLATIVEPAAEESQANVLLQVLNPLEIVRSNILLLTAKRSLEKGEKLSMDLSSGHFDTSAKAPVVDTELLGRP